MAESGVLRARVCAESQVSRAREACPIQPPGQSDQVAEGVPLLYKGGDRAEIIWTPEDIEAFKVAAIEARRKRPARAKTAKPKKPGMTRRAVFDDFGEPVRYEWVEPESPA